MQAAGRVQMAIDQWLLDQHCQGLHPPTLRFYTWLPAAISLGYHQRRFPEFWRQLTWQNQPIDLVQRPSGGRAVLHQGDLTYTLVTSDIPGNRMQAYQYLCEFLIRGWRSLGVDLQYGAAGRGYIHNPDCFGTATAADLVMPNGAKLIGSAQLRRGNTLLQQGSMRLNPDPGLFQQVFGGETAAIALPQHCSSAALIQKVSQALITSAESWFGIQLVSCPLSQAEWQTILPRVKP
ncbi:MAG: lipoate--protein ligase family protein [Leptolyngbyaceae cyanobacterium CRU_2_3]|nr:lipoate--protein ligase family protein [Leptolyngbyaceae cyanobacterium CRU_2_3]